MDSSCTVCKGRCLSLAARWGRGNNKPGRVSICFSLPADQGLRCHLRPKLLVPPGGQAGTSRTPRWANATCLLPVKKTPSWLPTVKVSQRNMQHTRRVTRTNRTWQGRRWHGSRGELQPAGAGGGFCSQARPVLNTTERPEPASPCSEVAGGKSFSQRKQ